MMADARETCGVDSPGLDGRIFAFDSTTIPLCLAVFPWAKFRRRKGGVKAHVLYDLETKVPSFYHVTTASVHDSRAMHAIPLEEGAYYVFDRGYNAFAELWRISLAESFFVVRAKRNLQFKSVKWRRRLPENVLGDAEIVLTETASAKKFPGRLRLVRFHDAEQDRDFAFLTNAFALSSLEVAGLYRNRWQVELFFKWLKQHLRIRKFWGTSENAVRIQLAVAVTTFCLVAIVRRRMQVKRSAYEMLQILEVSMTDKTPLAELFGLEDRIEPDSNETPFLPGLFD